MEYNRRKTKYVKKRTGRLIDRLTYCPKKHKQKFVKGLRRELLSRRPDLDAPKPIPVSSLKFGSININGLDMEASWAVSQILTNRGYDVRIRIL